MQHLETVKTDPTEIEHFHIHPRDWIEYVVGLAAYEIFGVLWVGKSTRASKPIELGELEFIDYSIPCFELAHKVKKSPIEIALQLSDTLQGPTFKRVNQKYLQYLNIEAVQGYLNFQLTDSYLMLAIENSAEWLKNPAEPKSHINTYFLMAGPTIGQALGPTLYSEQSYSYMHRFLKLMGQNVTGYYLLSDFSEDAAKVIAAHVAQQTDPTHSPELNFDNAKAGNIDLVQLHKRVKSALSSSDVLPLELDISEALNNSQTKLVDHLDRLLGANQVIFDQLLMESKLAAAVNQWLNQLPIVHEAEGVKRDDASLAAYYAETENIVPLRSAGGLLYKSSYFLYILDTILKINLDDNNDKKRIIALVPASYGSMLSHFVQFYGNAAVENVIFLETEKHIAVVARLAERDQSIEAILKLIGDQLQAINLLKSRRSQITRQNILSLVDLPVELYEVAQNNDPSQVLELLSKSTDLGASLEG